MYVRRYVAADWERVLEVARVFHAESPLHSPHPFDEARVHALLEAAMGSPDWLAALAIDGDEIVGIMLVFRMQMFFSSAYEVGDLAFYVRPDARGGRAARKMLGYAELWASAKETAVMRFGIMTGIRAEQSQRFFEKLGYDQVGTVVQKVAGAIPSNGG